MKTATLISPAHAADAAERMRRLRALAWLLDNSIALPGGYRIGLDPIIGLIPGLGDAIGAALSAWILLEARRMGVPTSVLLRMTGNVLIDAAIGAIPFAGDLFDAGFKANSRNIALLARHQLDPVDARRSSRLLVLGVSALFAGLALAIVVGPVLLVMSLAKLF